MNVVNGYAVEQSRQVLLSGTWDSEDCNWDWDTKYQYFLTWEGADKLFRSLRKEYSDDCPVIRMFNCEITLNNSGEIVETELGDEIKEYAMENGKKVVWYMYGRKE